MTTNDMLKKRIKIETDITRLKFMRDNGLDMAIEKFKDFTTESKESFIILINERIVELGGSI